MVSIFHLHVNKNPQQSKYENTDCKLYGECDDICQRKNCHVLSMLFPFRICLKRLTARLILVVHPVGGLIVRVDGVFVANLCRPRSLLTHVRSSDQLSAEVPALPTRQLHIHGHIIIRFLQARVFILLTLSWDSSHT